jgi:electron transfer flavoprotein alpha/beta subunit
MLLDAVACGADRVVRIDPVLEGEQASSIEVARALAAAFAGAAMVFCGDWSLDRGSGSVPALLSHFMGIDQALGVVAVRMPAGEGGDQFEVERRLDGGRREGLRVLGPSVISVEGAAASLRRAKIANVVKATSAVVEVLTRQMESAVPGITVERLGSWGSTRAPTRSLSATTWCRSSDGRRPCEVAPRSARSTTSLLLRQRGPEK